MYECPNCAANLRYHIEKKMLYCDHCETTMDPYAFQKEQDAEENNDYEVTVFSCPQCGGELISEDTTVATFCSFCGSSTILDSRISNKRRPKYIIPFSKTGEDCRDAYKRLLRRSLFAPKELKDPEHIEKFRGIYMPYWVYSFEKKGPVTLRGQKTHRRGDYLITNHYNVDTNMDVAYEGISFDASATFCDVLSSSIGPYDTTESKPFTPSFLSGFYGDTNDVKAYVYADNAEEMFRNDLAGQILKKREFTKHGVGAKGVSSIKSALRPNYRTTELSMFPVWFLSYRKDDRVAYAVVNGQTGKIAADLPVDIRKYLFGSLLLAIPIFVLLNLFFTLIPATTLLLSALLALICILITCTQLVNIKIRENFEDDEGYKHYLSQHPIRTEKTLSEEYEEQKGGLSKPRRKKSFISNLLIRRLIIMVIAVFSTPIIISMIGIGILLGLNVAFLFMVVVLLFVGHTTYSVIQAVHYKRHGDTGKNMGGFALLKADWKNTLPILAKPLLAIALALVIYILNPVEDLIYYIGAILCMATICWTFLDIIKRHNLLATRKLPQLNRRGGDENA